MSTTLEETVERDEGLEVSEIPTIKLSPSEIISYGPDWLKSQRESDESQQWPDYLDKAYMNSRGVWDPDRWHSKMKRGSTPPPGEKDDKQVKGNGERPSSSLSEGKVSANYYYLDSSIISSYRAEKVMPRIGSKLSSRMASF